MKIEIVDTKAYIYTPYNAEFVKAIKGIGGARWNRDKSAWAIPADCADQAREIMRRVYGEDDRPDCGERVDVRLTFDSSVSEWQSAVTIYGKLFPARMDAIVVRVVGTMWHSWRASPKAAAA